MAASSAETPPETPQKTTRDILYPGPEATDAQHQADLTSMGIGNVAGDEDHLAPGDLMPNGEPFVPN